MGDIIGIDHSQQAIDRLAVELNNRGVVIETKAVAQGVSITATGLANGHTATYVMPEVEEADGVDDAALKAYEALSDGIRLADDKTEDS